jgi:micrococcal nuclease
LKDGRAIVGAVVVLLCAACGTSHPARTVSVAAVPSGDTIRLQDGRIVRLLGVDAPSGRECHAYLSRLALAALVPPGTTVHLETPASTRAVVFRGDLNVNLELVRRGAASAYLRRAPAALAARLVGAARQAHATRRGAWGGCSAALDARRPWQLERRAPDRIFR